MPLNVRRYFTSIVLILGISIVAAAQAETQPTTPEAQNTPTSGDVMRERISKAKAFIAVRNYNAAIYELENLRRESGDPAVQGVTNVLLMNSYLEQGDYTRAQKLLNEFYTAQKSKKPHADEAYMAVAGQVVKGARSRAERYRTLGLDVADRSLPLEALNDLEKMRETLEIVITQSKELGSDKAKAAEGMALLEEAGNSRTMLARDDYDVRRWKNEVADTREQIVSQRSVVTSSVNDGSQEAVIIKQTVDTTPAQPVVDTKTVAVREREVRPAAKPTVKPASEPEVAKNDKPIRVPSAPVVQQKVEQKKESPEAKPDAVNSDGSIDVGTELITYATRQQQPIYPSAAKSVRATGTVRVEVTVNENGEVAEVHNTVGPMMLQSAAKDAIRRWRFKPFTRDGQPVKATGSVSFNFTL